MNPPRSRRRSRGNAMVEFALAATLFLPLFVGVFQFGYAFYNYNRLMAAVRAGARYASLRTYDSSTSTPSTTFLTAVQNDVVYGNPNGGTSPVVPGLTTSMVAVSVTMSNNLPDMITVSITAFSLDAVVKKLQFTNKPAASFRFAGRYAP